MNVNEFIESWQIHQRINLYLLQAIAPEHLADAFQNKGRSVAEQFAHLHNVRLMWLKVSAPKLEATLHKIEKGENLNHALLTECLTSSAAAIETLLTEAFESGKLKGFKPHPQAFLSYLISHESHHRGQIMLTLKLNGHAIDKKTQFGIWEWGVR